MWQRQLGLVKKWSFIVIGGLLVLLGLITFWLPLPIGVPLMLLGAPLLLRHSPHARAWWAQLRDRLPRGRGAGPH
jgi:uncharacterized membrane protein YbaN (DUF454 family)